MQNNYFLIFLFVLFSQNLMAAKVLVKEGSIKITGSSFTEKDLSMIYGGVAGTCATTDGVTTCNSCTESTSLQACNQSSIYPDLPLQVSFQVSEAIATNAVVKLIPLNSSGGAGTGVALTAKTYAADETVTISIPWTNVCSALGLTACAAGSSTVVTGKIGFGVDSDNNNDIETAEQKFIPLTIHFIKNSDTSLISNSICPTNTASGFYGICNMSVKPGDEKVYVDNALWAGIDASSTVASLIKWDALAVFPIKLADASAGSAATAITQFVTGASNPIFKTVSDDGSLETSDITGSLENYQNYCFIYGNRNKAQNIYRFVAGSAASGDLTTIAADICKSPSEVVGALEDKHCFISTAAFGSEMAPEVETFRQFRNHYLLTNSFGRLLTHFYYEVSPPIAKIISEFSVLKSITRGLLMPFLYFSQIALKYGILPAILGFMVLIILFSQVKSFFLNLLLSNSRNLNYKNLNHKSGRKFFSVFFIIFLLPVSFLILPISVLIFSNKVRAEVVDTVIQHPGAQDGLIRITKDGSYIYDVKREIKNQSGRFTFGSGFQPEVSIDIETRDAQGNGTNQFKTFSFDDLYKDASSLIMGYDYEWYPWLKKGKLGLQLGASLMYAKGHGVIVSSLEPSLEEFTFVTLPLSVGGVYRFEWKDKQWLAPYASAGGTYTVLFEKREDKSTPHYTGSPGFYATAGALFNITYFDSEGGFALENEYGISNLWFVLEYKIIEVHSDIFDFSNQFVNAGLAFDF